jgi:hypothetical protein
MSNPFSKGSSGGGGGGSSSNPAFLFTGGGTGEPWNWGVSPFDQNMIDQATASNKSGVTNRYDQLGLGGSTMEGQDTATAGQMGDAMTGQLQTTNQTNPALNPAQQPQINQIVGNLGGSGQNSTLSDLASAATIAGDVGKVALTALPLIGL